MATFQPIRAILYPPGVDPALVTSPPYDVISEAERERLAGLHPSNIVRIILPVERPGDEPGNDRYSRAAEELRAWIAAGTLVHDDHPCFYAYRMDYSIGGSPRSTGGVIGAVVLETLGEKDIFGHEKTMAKPRGDRRDLMRAARANLEPIWLVGGAGVIGPMVTRAALRPALVDVTDPDGVRHRLWPLDETESHSLTNGLRDPLVIADGHHRYSASLELRDDLRAAEGPGPWDATLALISDPTLDPPALLPIHRLTDLTLEQVAARVQLTRSELATADRAPSAWLPHGDVGPCAPSRHRESRTRPGWPPKSSSRAPPWPATCTTRQN
ncbi:MAG: hypothetical protein NVSMB32_15190 [Actinomycetota bacterium]